MYIKTKLDIGKFIKNSNIDGISIREISSIDELKDFDENDYEIIDISRTYS